MRPAWVLGSGMDEAAVSAQEERKKSLVAKMNEAGAKMEKIAKLIK